MFQTDREYSRLPSVWCKLLKNRKFPALSNFITRRTLRLLRLAEIVNVWVYCAAARSARCTVQPSYEHTFKSKRTDTSSHGRDSTAVHTSGSAGEYFVDRRSMPNAYWARFINAAVFLKPGSCL